MAINYTKQLYSNNATTALASTISASDTTISVVDGSRFPTPGPTGFFLVTISNGASLEVIEVRGRTGNTLTGCVRGREGTQAQVFASGSRVENRLTANTISSFARLADRLGPAASLTDLSQPELLNNNSYLIAEVDDAGNPIVAVASVGRWRFVNYPSLVLEQALTTPGSTTSAPITTTTDVASLLVADGMVIQFTTGPNRGQCRKIRSAGASAVSWQEPLPSAPVIGDRFEIYQSSTSQYRLLSNQVSILLGSAGLGGSFSGFVTASSLATELAKLDFKKSVRVATTANIALTGLQTIDGISVVGGDRVLVKDQSSGSQNGIYVADAGTWVRASDSDVDGKINSGMLVGVNEGASQAESIWRLATDGNISVGTTALSFSSVLAPFAKLSSPALTGVPTAPTAALGTNTTQLATTAFTQQTSTEAALVYAIALGG